MKVSAELFALELATPKLAVIGLTSPSQSIGDADTSVAKTLGGRFRDIDRGVWKNDQEFVAAIAPKAIAFA